MFCQCLEHSSQWCLLPANVNNWLQKAIRSKAYRISSKCLFLCLRSTATSTLLQDLAQEHIWTTQENLSSLFAAVRDSCDILIVCPYDSCLSALGGYSLIAYLLVFTRNRIPNLKVQCKLNHRPSSPRSTPSIFDLRPMQSILCHQASAFDPHMTPPLDA